MTDRIEDAVRNFFLGLGFTSRRFGPSEAEQARNLEKRGISLEELQNAMIVGACRKYVSWLSNGPCLFASAELHRCRRLQ